MKRIIALVNKILGIPDFELTLQQHWFYIKLLSFSPSITHQLNNLTASIITLKSVRLLQARLTQHLACFHVHIFWAFGPRASLKSEKIVFRGLIVTKSWAYQGSPKWSAKVCLQKVVLSTAHVEKAHGFCTSGNRLIMTFGDGNCPVFVGEHWVFCLFFES